MSKRWIGIGFVLAFSINLLSVNAACDYEMQLKLSQEAANVSATYEIVWRSDGVLETEMPNENGDYETEIEVPVIRHSIYNITENLYIVVKNLSTGEEVSYQFDDTTDGKLEWDSEDFSEIVNYEIKVYSNHLDCFGSELFKLSLVTPMYNEYADMYYCVDNDSYYCKDFITEKINMTAEQVQKLGEEYMNKKNGDKDVTDSLRDADLQRGYVILGIIGGIILIGGCIFLLHRKKQRSDVL